MLYIDILSPFSSFFLLSFNVTTMLILAQLFFCFFFLDVLVLWNNSFNASYEIKSAARRGEAERRGAGGVCKGWQNGGVSGARA